MPGDGRGRGANYPGLTPTATATNGNIGRIPDAGDLVAAALAYCAAGWSVIPCRVTGKRSLVRWKLWQQTAPDPEQLVIWWRRWPRANLAAITGRVSGVVSTCAILAAGSPTRLAVLASAWTCAATAASRYCHRAAGWTAPTAGRSADPPLCPSYRPRGSSWCAR